MDGPNPSQMHMQVQISVPTCLSQISLQKLAPSLKWKMEKLKEKNQENIYGVSAAIMKKNCRIKESSCFERFASCIHSLVLTLREKLRETSSTTSLLLYQTSSD